MNVLSASLRKNHIMDKSEIGDINNFMAIDPNGNKIDIIKAADDARKGIKYDCKCGGCGNKLLIKALNSEQHRAYFSHKPNEACIVKELKPEKDDPLGIEFHKRELALTEEQVENLKARISNLNYMFDAICDIKRLDIQLQKLEGQDKTKSDLDIDFIKERFELDHNKAETDFLRELALLEYSDQIFIYEQCRHVTCIAKTEFCNKIKDAVNQNAIDIINEYVQDLDKNFVVETPTATDLKNYINTKSKCVDNFHRTEEFSKLQSKYKRNFIDHGDDYELHHCAVIRSPEGNNVLLGDLYKRGRGNIRISADDLYGMLDDDKLLAVIQELIDADVADVVSKIEQENIETAKSEIDKILPEYKDRIKELEDKYGSVFNKDYLYKGYDDLLKLNEQYDVFDPKEKINSEDKNFEDLCRLYIEDRFNKIDEKMLKVAEENRKKERYGEIHDTDGRYGMFYVDTYRRMHYNYDYYKYYDGKFYGVPDHIAIQFIPFYYDTTDVSKTTLESTKLHKNEKRLLISKMLESHEDVEKIIIDCCKDMLKENKLPVPDQIQTLDDLKNMWDTGIASDDIKSKTKDHLQIPVDDIRPNKNDKNKQIVYLKAIKGRYVIFDDKNQFSKSGTSIDKDIECHALYYEDQDKSKKPAYIKLDYRDIMNICINNGCWKKFDQNKKLGMMENKVVSTLKEYSATHKYVDSITKTGEEMSKQLSDAENNVDNKIIK